MEQKFQQIKFFSIATKRHTTLDMQLAEQISAVILKSGSTSVFDAGCGEGIFTQVAAKAGNGAYVVGGDLSKAALSMAKIRLRGENVDLVLCDAEKLPFRNNSFDCIISVSLLHHLPSLNPIFEMNRTKSRGGPFFICDHAYLDNPLFFMFSTLANYFPPELLKFRDDIGPQDKPPHVFMYSFNHLMTAFKSMGYRAIYLRRDTLFLTPMISVSKELCRTFRLPFEDFLNGRAICTLYKLDDKLKKYLYRFCFEFVVCCVN